MFANCQMGGMNMGLPDVCMTPVGPSVVPIPYPNIAQGATADPSTAANKVLISGAPAHTLQTIIPMSSGDESGVCGGVMSGTIMGQCRHFIGASNVLIGGNPATKMTDQTGQNGTSQNISGSTIAPSQTKVIINSGGSGRGGSSSQKSVNSSEESEEKTDPTVKNPRWEHVDENKKKENPDIAFTGDIVKLQVDVTNISDGTTATFKIFDASTGRRLSVVYGAVTNGSAFVEWCMHASPNRDGSKPTPKFEARIHGLISESADIAFGIHFQLSV